MQLASNLGSAASGLLNPTTNPAINWALPQSTSAGVIRQLIIEIGGVLVFAVLAGINDNWANVVIAFLVALWLLALVAWKRGY